MPYADESKNAACKAAYALANPDEVRAAKRAYKRTPKGRFAAHKRRAKLKGIPFLMTFDQWWALWAPHWDKRGVGRGSMVMARNGDIGAYEVGNVRITTNEANISEAHKGKPWSWCRTRKPTGRPRGKLAGPLLPAA